MQQHIFAPPFLEPDHEMFPVAVAALQYKYFGPYPESFLNQLDEEGTELYRFILDHSGDKTQEFLSIHSSWLDSADKDFISYLMQPDPKDRPSADEALTHPWLDEAVEDPTHKALEIISKSLNKAAEDPPSKAAEDGPNKAFESHSDASDEAVKSFDLD